MAREVKFESAEINKVSETEMTITHKKVIEETVQQKLSIDDLRRQKASVLDAISETQKSKAKQMEECDRSISELQAQADHIDELIAEAIGLGVKERKESDDIKR